MHNDYVHKDDSQGNIKKRLIYLNCFMASFYKNPIIQTSTIQTGFILVEMTQVVNFCNKIYAHI